MYHGTNPTALHSQQWIVEALTALMGELPYQQISIMCICKRADLTRQTFYNVFDSKEEVLRFCLRRGYEKQFRCLTERQSITAGEIVEAFASVVEENRKLLRMMVENGLESILADEMTQCVSLFAGGFVKREKNNSLLPYAEVILSGALGQLLVYWFRQESPISMDALTGLISEFFAGRLFELA